MNVEVTKMSSKGQIVIPQDIRNELKMKEGTLFTIFGDKNTLILKKMETVSKEKMLKDLEKLAKTGQKRAEKMGIKESDIPKLIHKIRGVNE